MPHDSLGRQLIDLANALVPREGSALSLLATHEAAGEEWLVLTEAVSLLKANGHDLPGDLASQVHARLLRLSPDAEPEPA